MNYNIFEEMDGEYSRKSDETEQAYMERIVRAVVEAPPAGEKPWFTELMAPAFRSCDAEAVALCLEFMPLDWQTNPNGILHGGIISTAIDITFGILTRYCVRTSKTVTMSLTVNYMRSIPMEHPYYVRATANKVGRRVKNLYAEVIDSVTGRQAADATALFM